MRHGVSHLMTVIYKITAQTPVNFLAQTPFFTKITDKIFTFSPNLCKITEKTFNFSPKHAQIHRIPYQLHTKPPRQSPDFCKMHRALWPDA